MGTPATPRFEVTNPPLQPYRFGLHAAATILDQGDGPWELGLEYRSEGCHVAEVYGTVCNPPVTVTAATYTVTYTVSVTDTTATVSAAVKLTGGTAAGATITTALKTGAPVALTLGAAAAPIGSAPAADTGALVTATVTNTDGTTRQAVTTVVLQDGKTATSVVDDTRVTQDEKFLDGDEPMLTADPFVLYAAVTCQSVGFIDRAEAIARRRLLLGEQYRLEWWLENNVLAKDNRALPIVGTDPVALKEAVGALDAVLGSEFGGIGTIHVPRWTLGYLAHYQIIYRDGQVWRTVNGNPVVSGAGYSGRDPGGAAPAAGEAYLYATGPVVIRRSPVAPPVSQLDRTTNQYTSVAERQVGITTDCALYYARATFKGEG